MSRSGLITIVVETPEERFKNDYATLVSVEANTESESSDVLSDKDWFEHEWDGGNEDMLWGHDDRPGHGKRYEVKGYLWADQDYWGEWDGGFEIESTQEVSHG